MGPEILHALPQIMLPIDFLILHWTLTGSLFSHFQIWYLTSFWPFRIPFSSSLPMCSHSLFPQLLSICFSFNFVAKSAFFPHFAFSPGFFFESIDYFGNKDSYFSWQTTTKHLDVKDTTGLVTRTLVKMDRTVQMTLKSFEISRKIILRKNR